MKEKYRIRFSKIKADHNRIKDIDYYGTCTVLPKEGEMFWMNKLNFENQSEGWVNTSIVEKIELKDYVYTLYTQSKSIYEVTVLEILTPQEEED